MSTKIEKSLLDQILKEKQITLPDDFYKYLTEISTNYLIEFDDIDDNWDCDNCVYVNVYPKYYTNENISKIDLQNMFTSSEMQINIPENVTCLDYYFPEIKYCENDLPIKTSKNISIRDIQKSLICIGKGHQFFYRYYIYLGKGFHFGSIWVNNDISTYSEFPSYLKVFSSFSKFFERINIIKENSISLSDNDDFFLSEKDDKLINLFENYKEYDKFTKDKTVGRNIVFICEVISNNINNFSKSEYKNLGAKILEKLDSNAWYNYKIIIDNLEMKNNLIEMFNDIKHCMNDAEKIKLINLLHIK